MIKRITKLLNSRILLQQPQFRFVDAKEEELAVEGIVQQTAEVVKQQIQQSQLAGQVPQATAVQVQEKVEAYAQVQDPFEGMTLLESNWAQIAPLIHTKFYLNRNDPLNQAEINNKLNQIEAMYNFDLRNLERIQITQKRQFDLKSGAYAITQESNRFLQNDISENTRIGYNLITGKKFKQLVQTKNLNALRQTYRNDQYRLFSLQSDVVVKLIDSVVSSNFETQFLLNFLENYKLSERDGPIKHSKNLQKVLQNIHSFDEVNKLKFMWKVNHIFQAGQQLVNLSVINHELTKLSFANLDSLTTQKTLRTIYSSVLGKNAMKKLINYSLNKYSGSFDNFITFWGVFNLLISRLNGLNQSSLANPNNLSAIFQLFELNLPEPKEILTQAIPEALFETKNKSLFQIYRVHAKHWLQRKSDAKISVQVGTFDQFVNTKIDLQETIKVVYNPWKFQNFVPNSILIRTSKNASRGYEKVDELLSQTKMLEHLIRGDYNFVLNHLLIVLSPTLDKTVYSDLRKLILQAKQHQFSDENARAFYILKNINQRFFYLSEPVSFRNEYFTSFKKIKWLERTDKIRAEKTAQKLINDEGKFSRKRDDRIDPDEPFDIDNKQRIRSKPKKFPEGGALFSKKNKNLFSTQKDSYAEYRQTVKQVTPVAEFGFNMDKFTTIQSFKQQVQRRSKQMNENNHKSLLTQLGLPIVGTGANLMKYLFLKKPTDAPIMDQKLKKKLRVSFVSQIGALQKDFSQYLQNCRFNFPLAQEVYVALLQDQKTNYVRKSFKTIVTHLVAYRNSINDQEVRLICDICRKNKIGISLIEIYSLMIQNKTLVSKESIYILCDTLQKFKKINHDIFLMTKKYCENIKIEFEIKMMSSYVKSLLIEEQEQRLFELSEMIKNQLKPKPYKLKSQLTAEQNLKQEKEYKQFQKKQYNRILYEIIDMVVLNVNNKLPAFISQLFDEYEKTKTKLDSKEIALSLIVYCNNVEKFLQIIRSLKADPEKILLLTFQCAVKALRLNSKQLESHSQQIFNVTLFTHNFMLNEDLITRSVQIFKFLSTPTVYIKFLQYLLRFNPPLNYEIKNSMYFLMNNINDDFAKNTISGLLDFIFNSNREKERESYRKAQIAEEAKVKLLQDLEKKDFLFDKTENQKERMINDIESGNLEDAKKPKKNKSLQKQKVDQNLKEAQKQPAKNKVQKPASAPKQRRRMNLKDSDNVIVQSEIATRQYVVLKRSNLKKKLRTKTLNDFEDMFAQKEEIVQQVAPKGGKNVKGQKQPLETKKKGK